MTPDQWRQERAKLVERIERLKLIAEDAYWEGVNDGEKDADNWERSNAKCAIQDLEDEE